MMIKVSICCITFNHEKYIKKALDSFLSQNTDFEYEILIHDDASTDSTADIIRDYEKKYPNIIKPIYQTENQYQKGVTNPSGKFNFPRAKGQYIAMCEGDDYWIDNNKLQLQANYLDKNLDVSFCFHSAKIETVDLSFTDNLVRPYKKNLLLSPKEVIDKKSGYPTAALFFRTEYVKDLPKFYEECPIGDIPLQLILANKGSAYYIDKPMSVYRIGVSSSWSVSQKNGDYLKKQRQYYLQMKKLYLEFDKFSDKKFHSTVLNAIKRLRFLVAVNTKDYNIIFAKKYRAFYKELGIRTIFFTNLEYRFPKLYLFFQKTFFTLKKL